MDSNFTKKIFKFTIIFAVFIVILLLVLWIASLLSKKKLDYASIEEKMVFAAKSYYQEKSDLLPIDGGEVTISADTLSRNGFMKELSNYAGKGVSCSGEVVVKNNSSVYSYISFLDCGDNYKTKKLSDKILDNEEIVNAESGLYSLYNEYIYRGEYVNNYVSFADSMWRIIKIDSDGYIKLIQEDSKKSDVWDDRFNVDKNYNIGINNYEISRISTYLNDMFDEFFGEDSKSKIVSRNLCVGKRYEEDTTKDGSTECSEKLENQKVGLLQANEYLLASIDKNCINTISNACQNYNYLADYDRRLWTITPVAGTSYDVYYLTPQTLDTSHASNTRNIKMVIYLDKDVIYSSGIGTLEEPYLIR